MRFWGPCNLRTRGQRSKESVRHVEEDKGGAHRGGEPRGGLVIARSLAWNDRLHCGFALRRRLVFFWGGGRHVCGRGGGARTAAWGRGLWGGWRYYKCPPEWGKDFLW